MTDASEPDFERALQSGAALTEYVRSHFPKRFHPGERAWRATLSASLLGLADTVEHLTSQAATMPELDALTLLRSVFERAVTVAWILIDPDPRSQIWHQGSIRTTRAVVEEMRTYGIELREAPERRAGIPRLPSLDARADECDAHWASRVGGLHASGHHFSFRGLYTIVYRTGSASSHGALSSANGYIVRADQRVVVRLPDPPDLLWPALAVPLFAMALCIAATRIEWIDASRVRETAPAQ